MELEVIKALANLPLDFVLIYLIVKQQSQISVLLEKLVANEREHFGDIVRIVCRGDGDGPDRNPGS